MPRAKQVRRLARAATKAASKATARAPPSRAGPKLFSDDEDSDEASDVMGELLDLLMPDERERNKLMTDVINEGRDIRLLINEMVYKRRDDKEVERLVRRLEVVGACDCEQRMKVLNSPFSWGWPGLLPARCAYMADKLFQAGTDWNLAFMKLNLAHSLYMLGRRAEARARLVECYMLLMPGHFNRSCSIVNDHRVGLRHVLDSTWGSMCLTQRKQPCTGVDPALAAFLASIPPFETLSPEQKAAVLVLQGRFADDEGLLKKSREAIALSPGEGEWRHMLGWKLQGQRKQRGGATKPGAEELAMLRDAVRLRRSPDTLTRLAISLVDVGPAGRTEARQLVDQALAEYPNSAAVLTQATVVISRLGGPGPALYTELESLLARALAAAGECAHLHMKLGMVLRERGKARLAKTHFQKAAVISTEAVEEFMKEVPSVWDAVRCD